MKFAPSLFTPVGIAAVILVPLAHLDGINRFAQLPPVLALHIVAVCGFIAWMIWGRWRSSPLVLPALVFLLAEVVSVFQAQSRVLSLLPISTHWAGFALFLALLNGLKCDAFFKVVRVACVVAGVLSLFGLMQFWGIGQTWVPTAGLPSATFGHRNLAAAYLIGMIPLTFWLWWSVQDRWTALGWGVILGLEGAFLLATRSRGAWVGLFVGGAVIGFAGAVYGAKLGGLFQLKRAQGYGLGLALLVIVGTAVMPAQVEKGAGEAMWHGKVNLSDALTSVVSSGGDKSRFILWQHTLEMIGTYPFAGVGAGNWRLMYPVFAHGDLMHPQTVPYRPHNDFLWIWSETGVVGAIGFVALIWVVLRLGWISFRVSSNGIEGALLCSIIAVVVNGLFGFSRAFPGAWLPFWIAVIGLGVLQAEESRIRPNLRWGILLGILALIASGFVIVRQIGFDRQFLKTRIAFAQEQWPMVVDAANRALHFGAFDEEALLMRGRAFSELGNATRALDDYRAGLRIHPHSVGLWNGVGNALRTEGQLDGARQSYLKALQFDPASGEAFNNLGTLYAATGLIDSALAVYQEALKYAIDLRPVYANMSIVYRKKGLMAEAIESAKKALSIDPDHLEALVASGNALLTSRRFAEAAQTFSKGLQVSPDLIQLHFSLAQAYDGLGDVQGAVVSYQNFLNGWAGGDVPQIRFAKRRLDELASP
ncbi:MAG: tetratricopeptide (TPR) repeat protein/O-antigen ligase [Candidatus Latescibacterota bacterium]|jgi:tetratricopeptide (TPR) repeat protein/O-antigen ligase